MIKKVFCTLSLLALGTWGAQAQKAISPCGTDEVYHRLLHEHPEIAARDAALNEEIANKLSKMTEKDLLPFAKTTDDGSIAYDVPLVFHVIHDYGSEYVSDDAIRNCVARVNRMYNKQNPDTIDVIPTYRGFINNSNTRYIGNARITWRLATIDPSGKPTNGITRRRSYLATRGSDWAKYDQWPPNNYMNVWVIRSMSEKHSSAAAYAYKPATADVIPYYDGPIMMSTYISEADYTLSHELGHELNLDHPWGSTNNPVVACGDDEVDDTPPTKGHNNCTVTSLYDTACLFNKRELGKIRLDSFVRPGGSFALIADTSTSKGITFKNRTTTSIDTFIFYPAAAIGSTYKIGLKRNNTIIDSFDVVSTTKDNAQLVTRKIIVPPGDTATNFHLFFMQNPGAWRDTINSSPFSRGVNGTIWMRSNSNIYTDNYYNFFYDWKIKYGFYKIYSPDSLVDYPDTTNTQNVMDYAYCSKMFTAGQVARMRAALTSNVARRSSLITAENLARTGALDPLPALAPKAELSVERGATNTGLAVTSTIPSYFLCADNPDQNYNFRFIDRSWRATATTKEWLLSNGATSTTPTSLGTLGTGIVTRFTTPGWANVKMVAENANGKDTFELTPSVYVADPVAVDPLGYWQDFDNEAQNAKWPMFNYYNNRYKWELTDIGTFDNKGIRYRSYDDRTFPENLVGEAQGDYDDVFTPAFDLSKLGPDDGNLNFMYAAAYATNNSTLMRDTLEIAYSSNCGANWTVLRNIGGTALQTAGSVVGREYTPSWEDWRAVSIDLRQGTTAIRDSRVFFRFRYKPSSRPIGQFSYASGNNLYMDRFFISNGKLSVNQMVLGDKMVGLSPNPATNSTFVLFQKPNNNVQIQVLDMTGKLVYSMNTKIDQNNAKVELPVNQFGAKGIYMVRITGDDNLNQTEKLVVY